MELYTRQEAAKLLKIGLYTLDRRLAAGDIIKSIEHQPSTRASSELHVP